MKEPEYKNGKICYIEIPAASIKSSAEFYQKVVDWTLHEDNAGNTAFTDPVGQVSGMWVTGRLPAKETGFIISIMVADIQATIKLILLHGGKIIKTDLEGREKTAHFSDPFGNVLGLYQQKM